MIANTLDGLLTGLPVLLAQYVTALVLLGLGGLCYMTLTPFHEMRLIRQGNVAAGMVAFGTLTALSLPVAATLATSHVVLDIVIWGLVASIIQLVAFVAASRIVRDLPAMIEAGNVAAALLIIGIQLAVAILNAGAMMG